LSQADLLPNTGGVAATIVVTMTREQYLTGHGLAQTSHGALVLPFAVMGEAGEQHAMSARAKSPPPRERSEPCVRRSGPGGSGTAPWTQIHHIPPDSEGGPTSTDNAAPMCPHDHVERIKQGWTAMIIGGRTAWIPPPTIDPSSAPSTTPCTPRTPTAQL